MKRGEPKPPVEVIRWSPSRRGNGVIELLCAHGIGHPSQVLTGGSWGRGDNRHGCDNCCADPSFLRAEAILRENPPMKMHQAVEDVDLAPHVARLLAEIRGEDNE